MMNMLCCIEILKMYYGVHVLRSKMDTREASVDRSADAPKRRASHDMAACQIRRPFGAPALAVTRSRATGITLKSGGRIEVAQKMGRPCECEDDKSLRRAR